MAIEIRKATKAKSKLRLGLIAPSGAGKTWSSLLIAKGIGDKILVGDTENGSADLYADAIGFDYDVAPIQAPFLPSKYVEVIRAAEANGYDVVILDSLSHAWAGAGGLLDQQGNKADATGNSWTAWRTVTPQHNELIDAILQSKVHVIVTMRAKTEYVQEKDDKGKTVVRKVGMSPIQRDGMEYEFTTVFDLSHNHIATASKDRTNLFDNLYEKPSVEMGKKFRNWLESGAEVPKAIQDPKRRAKAFALVTEVEGENADKFWAEIKNHYIIQSRTELSNDQLDQIISRCEKKKQGGSE